jgi:hypothetical protein
VAQINKKVFARFFQKALLSSLLALPSRQDIRVPLTPAARNPVAAPSARQVFTPPGAKIPKVSATSMPPTVCPSSLATDIMPLALPVRLAGAVVIIALLLGG